MMVGAAGMIWMRSKRQLRARGGTVKGNSSAHFFRPERSLQVAPERATLTVDPYGPFSSRFLFSHRPCGPALEHGGARLQQRPGGSCDPDPDESHPRSLRRPPGRLPLSPMQQGGRVAAARNVADHAPAVKRRSSCGPLCPGQINRGRRERLRTAGESFPFRA